MTIRERIRRARALLHNVRQDIQRLPPGLERDQLTGYVIRRVTRKAYGHNSTWTRKLVVQLEGEDLISIWPIRSTSARFSINVWDLYQTLALRSALVKRAERARSIKAKKAEQRERRRLDYMERKLIDKT